MTDMSCAAWPGDLVAITGAGMGGGRRASVCCGLGNYWAHTHTCLEQSTIRPRPPSFLSRICPKSPCDLAERFSYVYPKTGLSCTISCINQSAAARHPLNWIVAQRYAQSRTFFVLATSLLMDRADPSKPCTQRIPTKPRYRSLFKPLELILNSLTV